MAHVGDWDLDMIIEIFLELEKVPQAKRTPKELVKTTEEGSPLLKDQGMALRWQTFHQEKATLKAMNCDEYVRYVKEDREDILLGVNP